MIQFSQQAFRTLRGFAVVALTAGLMVGCGGDEEAVEPTDEPAAASKPAAPAGAGGSNDAAPGNQQQAAKAPGNGRQVMGAGGGSPAGNGRQVMGAGGGPPAGNGRQVMGAGGGRQVMGAGGGSPAGNSLAAGGADLPPPEPPRSEDYSAWSKKDFKDAVRERDQDVIKAIEWLAENEQTDASAELLIELLSISKEPAKKPPAGIRGGRPGGGGLRRPGGGGNEGGGGGGSSLTASLDNQYEMFQLVAAVLNGRLATFSTTTILVQNGPPQGSGGNPYGNSGGGQSMNGGPPPPGANGNPYGNSGGGQSANGGPPPPGAGGNPYGNSGGGQSMNGGPPPPGANGNPYGNSGGGQGASGGPPPPGAGGNPYGGGGNAPSGGNSGLGPGGLGRGNSSPAANPGSYAHYGTLDMDMFIKTSVASLLKLDSPKAWTAIASLMDGSMSTSMPPEQTSELILTSLLENYGDPGHPSHQILIGLVNSDSAQSAKAMELFTDYAGTAIDQLMGLVEPATEGGEASGGRPGAGGNGRTLAGAGGGNGRSLAGAGGGGGRSLAGAGGGGNGRSLAGAGGGGNGRSLSGGGDSLSGGGPPGGGNGRSLGGAGGPGGNRPPARKSVSLSMASRVRPMTSEQLSKITSFLWHPDFAQAIAGKLERGQLAENSQLIALVGSIPTPIGRQAQYGVLYGNQKDGADSFTGAGFFRQVAKDPGIMVTLKSMPQQKRSPGSAQSSWDEATKVSALALRDRLRTAADVLGQGAMPSPSPVRLHKGAEVQTVFRTKWPNDITSEVGTGKPGFTDVLYVRMSVADQATLPKLSRHYEARVGANKKIEESVRKDATRQIVWLSGMRSLKTGMKRSMDVVFSQDRNRQGGGFGGGGRNLGGAGGGGAGGGAIIEIIVVDAPNPTGAVASASLGK